MTPPPFGDAASFEWVGEFISACNAVGERFLR